MLSIQFTVFLLCTNYSFLLFTDSVDSCKRQFSLLGECLTRFHAKQCLWQFCVVLLRGFGIVRPHDINVQAIRLVKHRIFTREGLESVLQHGSFGVQRITAVVSNDYGGSLFVLLAVQTRWEIQPWIDEPLQTLGGILLFPVLPLYLVKEYAGLVTVGKYKMKLFKEIEKEERF